MDWLQLGGIVAGLVSGAITKWASKKKGSTVHKVLAPVAAVTGAAGAAAAMGENFDTAVKVGISAGTQAVFGHNIYRGLIETAKGVKK